MKQETLLDCRKVTIIAGTSYISLPKKYVDKIFKEGARREFQMMIDKDFNLRLKPIL